MSSLTTLGICVGIALAPVGRVAAATLPATAAATAAATAPPPRPAAARPAAIDLPPPPERATSDTPSTRGADALIGVGVASLSLGTAALLLVAFPAWGLRNISLDRARRASLRHETWEYRQQAESRQTVALTALGIGSALGLVGVTLLVTGIVRHRQARRLSLSPSVERGFAGASATLRF